MNKYTIEITNHTHSKSELIEYMELSRERFTSREFKEILLNSLFFFAAESNEFMMLSATVKCDGREVFTVRCDTTVDGSNIRSTITAARPKEKYTYIRTMTIAA